ncbi:MAG: hypothetical protein KKC75_08570 [Nanoarchaeota archaeon]|nr:hypothetical protein [Nanoarchaeota archaeon]MBU1004897.1 hypothetical protein [Nanoarchaeota archaeon]MBU1946547.1 hypothetical protein [Nanoarchaeota archaeon]
MNELEEIKKRKLIELQKQQESVNAQEQYQLKEQLEQFESVVRQFLSKEALQRYGNIKAAHKEHAVQLLVILGQAIQKGQIKSQISDEQLKNILKQIQPEKKDFNIKRV